MAAVRRIEGTSSSVDLPRRRRLPAVAAIFVLAAPSLSALAQDVPLAERLQGLPAELAAEVEARLTEAAQRAPEITEAERAAALVELQARVAATEPTDARAATGGVTASARCKRGYITATNHRASAADVEIVASERIDCDASGCRALQVTAARDTPEPFDLLVTVSCSG